MFETIIGWSIWIVLGAGYLALLGLTERSAARYVASPRPTGTAGSLVIIRGAAGSPAEQVEQSGADLRLDHGLAT